MNASIKTDLKNLALSMGRRDTAIMGYQQTFNKPDSDTTFNKKGKIKRAFLQGFTFKMGAKPVNNYRTLKKAYRRGGAILVAKTLEHYKSDK
jgi:hypothetical protein